METRSKPDWTETLVNFLEQHETLTEPVVFLLGFAESIVFVSILVPSTVLFLTIGGAHSAIGGTFWPVWAAGATGAILGDMISYAIGRRLKRNVKHVWPLSNNPRWVAYARLTVSNYGILGVVASKFLGMARPFVPVIAGSMGMKWTTFFLASSISSIIWAGVFLAPGYGVVWFMSR